MMKKLFFGVLLMWVGTFAQAQIAGKVIDLNGEPLFAVNILIVDTETGTTTDIDGLFTLKSKKPLQVEISYIGYNTLRQVLLPGEENIIALEENEYVISCPIFIEDKYYQPFAYKKIENIDIEKIDILNPANIYNPTPGLFMHSGALNTNRLTIRGIGSRSPFSTAKIKAYLNDIPLTSGIGESNLEDLNLSILDEIKVYKGPSKPHFGSGLGGVIHYKTTAVKRENNKLANTTSIGSFNTLHNNIAYNYSKDGIIFSLNHDFLKSDGYRDNNIYQRENFSGFAQANFDKDVLTVFVSQTYLDAEIPSGLNVEDFISTPEAAAANWGAAEGFEDYDRTQVAITHQRIFDKGWTSSVTGFITSFQNFERRPFNVLTQNSKTIGARVLVEKQFQKLDGGIKFGNELFFESEEWSTYETLDVGQGNILSDNFENRNYQNIFAEAYYSIDNFQIDVGANLNFTSYDFQDRFTADGIDQSGIYSFNPILSPFLSISQQRGEQNIYASLSHGYSAPTLEETLTPDGLINPEIKPETGWNAELGLRKEFNEFSVDLAIYNMWVENLLVAQRVTEDQFVGINAGKTLHPGLETSVTYDKSFNRNNKINASIDYGFQPHQFTEFVNREIDFQGNQLPGNPLHKLSSTISYTYKKLNLKASNLLVSDMYADDANSIKVDGYNVTNFHFDCEVLNKNNWQIGLGGQVNNIFDKRYASMISVNPTSFGSALPRYLYAGLPRNFKITVQLSRTFS